MTMPDTTPFTDASPLRERVLQALQYPLQSGPLSTIIALAVTHTVVGWLPSLISGFFDLFVWAALFKYSLEVVRWSANGRAQAPEISFTVSESVGVYAVLLLLLAEVLLSLVNSWYGTMAALGLGIVLMAVMPAMVIILALEEGALRALNPLAWLQIGQRLGREYLLLVGFFCVTLIAQSVVAFALAAALLGFFATLSIALLVDYLLIANFRLIGVVIHDHSDELGYVGHAELQDQESNTDPTQAVIAAARRRAAGGDETGAAALLRDEIKTHPDAIPLHIEYRHWLSQCDDKVELSAHARQFIPILLRHDQDARAMDVARESKQLDPAFALDNAEDITHLAAAAAAAGQTQLAIGLISGFHKRFRGHPDVARNYLLAGKLLAERMNKEMPARALLHQIKLDYPNDPAIAEVDAYLAFLDKLAATPTRGAAPS